MREAGSATIDTQNEDERDHQERPIPKQTKYPHLELMKSEPRDPHESSIIDDGRLQTDERDDRSEPQPALDQETRDRNAQERIVNQKTQKIKNRISALTPFLTISETEGIGVGIKHLNEYIAKGQLGIARNYLDSFSDLIDIYEREVQEKETALKNTLIEIDSRIAQITEYLTPGENKSISEARTYLKVSIEQRQYKNAEIYAQDLSDILMIYEEDPNLQLKKRNAEIMQKIMKAPKVEMRTKSAQVQTSNETLQHREPSQIQKDSTATQELLSKSTPELQRYLQVMYGLEVDEQGVFTSTKNTEKISSEDTILQEVLAELQSRNTSPVPQSTSRANRWTKFIDWVKS